jgi:hypothetical protein
MRKKVQWRSDLDQTMNRVDFEKAVGMGQQLMILDDLVLNVSEFIN